MSALTSELLDRIRSRAAGYDRENAFFTEDLDELKAAGYLRPRPLLEVVRDQRRLGAYGPATALAVNMHLVIAGIARVLHERGDASLDWVLDEAEAGEVFAFGLSEPGNDLVLWDSLTTAERVDGGFAFTGTKIFTSLSPAWTRLAVFGKQTDGEGAEDGARLVHGIVTRGTDGVTIADDWDTLGMRATQSNTTRLDHVVVPDERITRFLPVGPNADPFVFAVFANFLLSIASVYAGIADRAIELAAEAATGRRTMTGSPLSADPDVRWRIADAVLALDAIGPDVEGLAADVDGLIDHGALWFRRLTGAKHRSIETARFVVDQALRVAGGSGFRNTSELARLERDVLAGIYHPSSTKSIRDVAANSILGPVP